MRLLASAVVIATLCAQPVLAQERLELAPSSNWNIQYDAQSCALRRDFGPVGSKMFLELRSIDPVEPFNWQVVLASPDIDRTGDTLWVGFAPDATYDYSRSYDVEFGSEYQGRMFDMQSWQREVPVYEEAFERFRSTTPLLTDTERRYAIRKDGSYQITRQATMATAFEAFIKADELFRASPEFDEASERWASSIEGFAIDKGFAGESMLLRTGPMDKAFGAMQTCLDGLLESWGFDVAAHRTMSRSAKPNNSRTYAEKLQRRRNRDMRTYTNGPDRVVVRVEVSAAGEPTACHLQQSLTDEAYGAAVCEIMQKDARFDPALDAAGAPMASYYLQSVIYTLE